MLDPDRDPAPVDGVPDEEPRRGPDGLSHHPGPGSPGGMAEDHRTPGQGPRQRLQKVPGSHQEEDRASYSVSMARSGSEIGYYEKHTVKPRFKRKIRQPDFVS